MNLNLIRWGIVIGGSLMLAAIFYRRYMATEKHVAAFRFFGKRKDFAQHFRHFFTHEAHEVTVDELAPEAGNVDQRQKSKADGFVKRADAFLATGDIKGAEKLLIQALAQDPSRLDAYHKLGLLYLRQEQFSKAESLYSKLVASAQTEPMYLSNLALALYHQGKLTNARDMYQRAIQIDPSRPGRFFSLARIFHELGEAEQALIHYQKASELDPKNVDYRLTMAEFYLEKQLLVEARQIVDLVLQNEPDHPIGIEILMQIQLAGEGALEKQPAQEKGEGNNHVG